MSARRGFGDETWRLALAGDAAALQQASELLLAGEPDGVGYDGHRALAFARALEGRVDEALTQLNEGWTEEWPFPSAYAADVARVRILAGDYPQALDALRLAARSAQTFDPAVAELAATCVRRDPASWSGALRVAASAGSALQRARSVAAVLRARL